MYTDPLTEISTTIICSGKNSEYLWVVPKASISNVDGQIKLFNMCDIYIHIYAHRKYADIYTNIWIKTSKIMKTMKQNLKLIKCIITLSYKSNHINLSLI